MPTPEKRRDDPNLGVLGQQLVECADVVEVGVGEPDPLELGGVDDRSQRGHEVVALDHRAGVDQDGLGTVEDERVERNESEPRDREGRCQDVDVRCCLVGGDHDVLLCWWG